MLHIPLILLAFFLFYLAAKWEGNKTASGLFGLLGMGALVGGLGIPF